MFATLLGGLPRPPLASATAPATRHVADHEVAVVVAAQEAAGLEPLTDGRLRDPDFERLRRRLLGDGGAERATEAQTTAADVVADWRHAAGTTTRAVKQALPGPYSVGRGGEADGARRERTTMAAAERLAEIVAGLAEAGCPMVEIEEAAAPSLGDEAERRLFAAAHRRLLEGGDPATHRALSIVGGALPTEAIAAVVDLPYASIAVDLIAGPDSWNLVTRLPQARGVIAGVLSAKDVDEPREIMLWAAHYAAATGARGIGRVGLGSAGSYANLTWEAAVRKMTRLGEAARLSALPPGEALARHLDPASISIRRAALGHDAGPPPPRRRRTRR